MEKMENRGKKCSTHGCKRIARVKGLCNSCYNLKKEYHKK